MINIKNTLRLLVMPMLWMGIVQGTFGLLSLFVFQDRISSDFFSPSVVMIVSAFLLSVLLRKSELHKVTFRDALMFASLTWVLTGFLGALPIHLVTQVSMTDAVFESISALTTTGATVLTGLDEMPKSFLLYRQFLQWMGGLGVVIFVVAVLPMLNVGGMRLLKAETPGPIKDDKLSPRISKSAHYLWGVYLSITLACALAYYLAGMSAYDAIAHSFTTVSTGGFSTHDASMWHFESHLILMLSNIFMMLGAISFGLHFRVFRNGFAGLRLYASDEESRVFILTAITLSFVLGWYLFSHSAYDNFLTSISFAMFSVISFMTSTGFGAADLGSWPSATALFLVFCAYLGGCSGSTAGGNKFARDIITFKVIRREIHQLTYPKAILPIRYQGRVVTSDVTNAVMAFMSLAVLTTVIFTLLMMATGLDFWSAFTAVAACINVLGPGFGQVGSNFQPVSDSGIWLLNLAMILGRLEYFTVLAMLLPHFWKK
ncbi:MULTISPECIES: TrkH family potassium uptake protein [unclassified Vibrio]|uniref:TrkH family potassium uptake protein n=1 Tax=unclassified Vibrio TaxID=2614977 RepID=UPI000B8EDC40|nr:MULTISPECIES: potassium transporter TrkG [unclassified Vibrio]NAX18714.1 potassium transporter [Vibrio sp. V22_P2S10T140]HCZ9271437.1 potassium transporter [Vibrio alginolyticus]OXX43873.1 potassium transporter [Vibrio sp. V07_P2A8T137]OXX65446.1 potassium transporter [Vibrio sp. V10_P2A27P122]PSD40504.1 potassium transporter [Vibrio sp. V02_P2A34T13]